MNFFETFVRRPVATTLLTLAIVLAGLAALRMLPVAPLPQVDYPTISVSASLPGASPETMAATVATPLERALGRIAGVNEMTSSSSLGSTYIVLQFDLGRSIDSAANEVQAAINAARSTLPSPGSFMGLLISQTTQPRSSSTMYQVGGNLVMWLPGKLVIVRTTQRRTSSRPCRVPNACST